MTPAGRNAATKTPVLRIDLEGNKTWSVNGVLHREDGPAIEYANGTKWWYRNGQIHRDDGQALEHESGTKAWYRHGNLHRDDGPAIEDADGTKEWYFHDLWCTKPEWLREVLKYRPLTTSQRNLFDALSENWEGTPDLLYETVTHLA